MHPGALLLALAAACAMPPPSAAQSGKPSSGGIYTCVDERGRRLTADRPIPECLAREQRVLNPDGSLKSVRPPSLTADERAQQEAREREAERQRAARDDALRRDRQLLQRYRNEAQHAKAREAALEPVRQAQTGTQARLAALALERQRLAGQIAAQPDGAAPARLKAQLDANDAAKAAQQDAAAGQQAEVERLNRRFDAELERLRRLWDGAAPGSLGPLPGVEPARAAAASAPRARAAP
jgi:hypothetical protein